MIGKAEAIDYGINDLRYITGESVNKEQPEKIVLGDNKYTRYIPKEVMEYFDNEFNYREVANWQPLTDLAMAYFTMLAMPQTAPTTGGGGGSSNDQGWGRDKDEDDLRFARRCAHAAIHKLGKKPKYGIHR